MLALVVLATVPGACAAEGAAQARAEAGCSQEDLAATIITVSDGEGPYLEFEVTGLGGGQVPPPLHLTTGPRPAGVTSFARAAWVNGSDRAVLSGILRLTEVAAGDHLSGRYDLTAPDGRKIAGSFSAPWPRGAVGCG